jgi:hypothetical protein
MDFIVFNQQQFFRRAQENTSVKGQTSRELGLILKERKRRAEMRGN